AAARGAGTPGGPGRSGTAPPRRGPVRRGRVAAAGTGGGAGHPRPAARPRRGQPAQRRLRTARGDPRDVDRPARRGTRVIRIGNASGFYGDRFAAVEEMLAGGQLDVLTGDYLA